MVTWGVFQNHKKIPYACNKTAVDLFIFLLFCLWSIREGSLFKKVAYLVNLPAGQLAFKIKKKLSHRKRIKLHFLTIIIACKSTPFLFNSIYLKEKK